MEKQYAVVYEQVDESVEYDDDDQNVDGVHFETFRFQEDALEKYKELLFYQELSSLRNHNLVNYFPHEDFRKYSLELRDFYNFNEGNKDVPLINWVQIYELETVKTDFLCSPENEKILNVYREKQKFLSSLKNNKELKENFFKQLSKTKEEKEEKKIADKQVKLDKEKEIRRKQYEALKKEFGEN